MRRLFEGFALSNRRDVLALGLAAGALLTGPSRAFAGPDGARSTRLETRLFNIKSDVSPDQTAAAIAGFKARAAAADLDGFMLGRNAIAEPFPTRFEWIYMAQWDPASPKRSEALAAEFLAAQNELASLCRDQAICDLNCPLPAGYGGAPGVKVRHTVMFSFKPEATAEDRLRNVDAIRGMGRLPMVQAYRVEPRMPSATGPDQMEWQVIGDFASMADYRAYAAAPVHLAIRQDFQAHTSRVAFLDVEL
jgi:hypothetical protein